MVRIIIAGGTGLVGQALVPYLTKKGYETVILSRKTAEYCNTKNTQATNSQLRYSSWNPYSKSIDKSLFEGEYYLINLSGENIGGKRWTNQQKDNIISSRVAPANFLAEICHSAETRPIASISASAIGIYGATTSKHSFVETDAPASDFLGETCRQWEHSTTKMASIAQRNIILRLGIVLSAKGGALPKMAMPVRLFAGNYIGNGKQYISWIHIDDLCRWIIYAIEHNEINGVFNTCSPESMTNKDFTRELCSVLHRPFIPFGIPKFVLKTVLGEMSAILTEGSQACTDKISNSGFAYTFPSLKSALSDIYR